jgi:hypothetical protein
MTIEFKSHTDQNQVTLNCKLILKKYKPHLSKLGHTGQNKATLSIISQDKDTLAKIWSKIEQRFSNTES